MIVDPTNFMPRFFKSADIASESSEVVGISWIVR